MLSNSVITDGGLLFIINVDIGIDLLWDELRFNGYFFNGLDTILLFGFFFIINFLEGTLH